MTAESAKEFHSRRAIEEWALAERATDRVQAIPHDQLSKLHFDQADAFDRAGVPQAAALNVSVMGNSVAVSSGLGEVTSLTPSADGLTADRLVARAHDAAGISGSRSDMR